MLLLLAALIAAALTVQLLGGGRGHGVRPSDPSECSRTVDRLTPRALRRFCDDPFGHAPRGARARAWPFDGVPDHFGAPLTHWSVDRLNGPPPHFSVRPPTRVRR
jgi:hypothetical protein